MEMRKNIPGLGLGIIGGGQLGRMMAVEARRMGIRVVCLDPSQTPPAHGIAHQCLQGDLYDPSALEALAKLVDVLTFEIEHISTPVLWDLENRGWPVYPSPRTLELIQDKFIQKQTLKEAGLPVPHFQPAEPDAEGLVKVPSELGFEYPVIQKSRTGGYDGRGVFLWKGPEDVRSSLRGASFFEENIRFTKELAVLLARTPSGEIRTWPVIEMVFDPRTQICNRVCAPARISEVAQQRALELGKKAVEALGGVGVFAVELFLVDDDRILINEVAPRPHNSGHWTIEGSLTNQFNQHIRAVCGLPLGCTEMTMPAVTVNLLGADRAKGVPVIQGYSEALSLPGLSFHWYEKNQVSTQRKMGHITVIRPTLEQALEVADKAESMLQILGNGV